MLQHGTMHDGPGVIIRVHSASIAIRGAMAEAGPDDIVLIAGKGHEDYQIIGEQKLHFNDKEVALQALEAGR